MNGGLEATLAANREALLRFLRARGARDPEDILQEVWVKIAAPGSGPVADPLPYLYRVANNLMLDRVRAAQRRQRREDDWLKAAQEGAAEASSEPSQEQVLLARERLREVEGVLLELGERTDAIFRRFRLDGVSQAKIASEQGISLSSVEKHLQRAYRALADLRRRSCAG